jgi:hypothetical protein
MPALAKKNSWFAVDKEGLGKLVERRGKAFVVFELLQNAWDCEDARQVDVKLTVLGRGLVELVVADDNPEGFRDISHAYTLFAPSEKKGDALRRGRFNLGEKLVLAICERASVTSVKSQILFQQDGTRRAGSARMKKGSEFRGILRMTLDELAAVRHEVGKLLPPAGVLTTVDDVPLRRREPEHILPEVFLQTEIAGTDGVLRRKYRDADVHLHTVRPGERATLYEMGIPVVDLGDDPFHVDVRQKVPLTMERDGVPPSFLRDVRGAVLDGAHFLITREAAAGKWTQDAIEASENKDAVKAIVARRFGDKVVIADPSDPEGTKIAASRDFVVIPGGAFTGDAWEKIREARAALPAGQVTPSPKPFSPDGKPLEYVPDEKLEERAKDLRALAIGFAKACAGLDVGILFTRDPDWGFRAAYSCSKDGVMIGQIIFNLALLNEEFWGSEAKKVELILHEIGHHWGGHLDETYHQALCRIGANAATMTNNDWRQ